MHTTRRSSRKGIIDYIVKMITFLGLIFIVVFCLYINKKLEYEKSNIEYQLQKVIAEKQSIECYVETLEVISSDVSNLNNQIDELTIENTELKIALTEKIDNISQYFQNYGGSFKSWTDYRKLSKRTREYKLCASAEIDENGFLIKDGAYLVALGSSFGGDIGDKFLVLLDSGITFTVIRCDFKDDKDTDETNTFTLRNGCVTEFYVRSDKLNKNVKIYGSAGVLEKFKGNVIGIIPI